MNLKEIKKAVSSQLLSEFIWGRQPKNLRYIELELKERGISSEIITEEVNNIIKKYAKK